MKCGWSELTTYLHVTIKIKYMLTKQLRELERQSTVVNQPLLKLSDLMELDGMYYVGDLVDMDGSGWVSKEVALDLIYNLNIDWIN